MARIERARAQGRSDVDLNKHELAALDRRRKRMEEEAKKKRKGDRKKKKEQRIAVPLTQLEPASRKNKGSSDALTRYPSSSSNLGDAQDDQGYPRMGYFPPPTASRSRVRSGNSSQRQPSRARPEREAEYMSGSASTTRHASDTLATRRSGRGSPPEEPWVPNVSPTTSRLANDPFQFQTEGPRTRSSRRPASGPAELAYPSRRGAPASRSSHGSRRQSVDEETSEDSDESDDEDYSVEADTSSSDHTGNGAQIRETPRGRAAAIAVEADAEREPKSQPVKKSASKNHSPVKRKPAVRGGRRKK
ncbi:hypothetical protein EDB81DRAFT_876639 [Dactylonectria macrodidyma]|uniref:Uncharacterized protein n=1 Tax=Dactylonectria macrodidyma TaxID=307937 RepID=A0A9P9JL86_9HYPO|nr:hypothetical protein EDB81DRAFT_876639 [Dactylonectria macrodidyma]